MTYHIASDDQIKKSLKKVITKYRTVHSQSRLRSLIIKELSNKKEEYTVSNARLRNIAINSNFIKFEIHSREGDPRKTMNKCPVCNSNLKRVKNLTIWGGEVTIEFKCSKCGYWTGKKKRIPTRYDFHLKKRKNNLISRFNYILQFLDSDHL